VAAHNRFPCFVVVVVVVVCELINFQECFSIFIFLFTYFMKRKNFIKLVKKFTKIVFPPYDDYVIQLNHEDFSGYDMNIRVEDRKHQNCVDFSVILHGNYGEDKDDDDEEDEEDYYDDDDDDSDDVEDDDAFKRLKGEIFINHLDKCENGSGTELLKKIEYLAKLIGLNRLGLYDASTIKTNCGFLNKRLVTLL
jgi:hypothetical protein